MSLLNRRAWFSDVAFACGSLALWGAADEPRATQRGLGFSLYGSAAWPLAEAAPALRAIGYDCVEIPVMADGPWAPTKLTADTRRELRRVFADHDLRISALMDNLPILPAEAARNEKQRESLRRDAEFAHDLGTPRPVIETILGGRPADWPACRPALVEELGRWAELGQRHEVVVAIKPHVSGSLHTPTDAAQILEQINSPWLRAVFDFSHYQLRDLRLAECWSALARYTVFVHVKDVRGDAGKFQFLLPGQGSTDYVEYGKLLAASGYQGDVVVEVSSQVHSRPDFQALAAARTSGQPLAMAFHTSGWKP